MVLHILPFCTTQFVNVINSLLKKLDHIVIGDNWIPHLFEQSLIFFIFLAERENAAITGAPTSSPDGNTKSGKEGGRGGRKK